LIRSCLIIPHHRYREQGQKKPDPFEDEAEVVTGGGEDGVDSVALGMGEAIAVHAVVIFEMPDDRVDGRAALHLAIDGGRDAAHLSGGEDTQSVDAGHAVASVAGIGEDAFQVVTVRASISGITVSRV